MLNFDANTQRLDFIKVMHSQYDYQIREDTYM